VLSLASLAKIQEPIWYLSFVAQLCFSIVLGRLLCFLFEMSTQAPSFIVSYCGFIFCKCVQLN